MYRILTLLCCVHQLSASCDPACSDDFVCKTTDSKSECVCPDGTGGPFCSVTFKPCPGVGNETFCDNGSYCQYDIRESAWHCGCESADYSRLEARRFCQHFSTVFCNDDDKVDVTLSHGEAKSSYCLNFGTCREAVEGQRHGGCNCTEEWKGDFCEVPANDQVREKYHYDDVDEGVLMQEQPEKARSSQGRWGQRRYFFMLSSFLVAAMAFGSVAYALYDGMRETNRQRRKRIRQSTGIPTSISANRKRERKKRVGYVEPMAIEGSRGDKV